MDGAASGAIVSNGTVYIGGGEALYAVDVASGTLAWPEPFDTNGRVRAPAIADGTVYVGSKGGHVYAIDAETGSERWRWAFPKGGSSRALTIADGILYAPGGDDRLFALDADRGSDIWSVSTSECYGGPCETPAVADNTVYLPDDCGALLAIDATTGKRRWRFANRAGGATPTPPTITDGTVYFGTRGSSNDSLIALAAEDGSEQWRFTSQLADVRSSPAVVNGQVYFGSDNGNVYAVDGDDGTEIWDEPFSTGDSVRSSPAVANGVVYIGSDDGYLYGIDAQSGTELFSFDIASKVGTAPAVVNDTVYTGGSTGSLYALSSAESSPDEEDTQQYEISDINELQSIADDLDGNYRLTTDIDASVTSDWNDGKGFDPIGEITDDESPRAFTGTFDGQGHTIRNLTINRPDEMAVGLFGVTEDATIKNVSIADGSVTGGVAVGELIGGMIESTVTDVRATGEVQGDNDIGGLVGISSGNGTITDAHATVRVSATEGRAGGLVSLFFTGTIRKCHATGDVTAGARAGGLIADLAGTVRESYATGDVDGQSEVGGLIGRHHGTLAKNTHARGAVTGDRSVGGLVGWNQTAEIASSYATGRLTGEQLVGGIVGQNEQYKAERNPTVRNAYWDAETTGVDSSAVLSSDHGLSTDAMTGEDVTDNLSGFNFETTWEPTASYPELRWQQEMRNPSLELSLEHTGCQNLVPGGVAEFDLRPTNTGDESVPVRIRIRTDELPGTWPVVRISHVEGEDAWTGQPATLSYDKPLEPDEDYVRYPDLLRVQIPQGVSGTLSFRAEMLHAESSEVLATASTQLTVDPDGFDPRLHGFGFVNFGGNGPGHDHGNISPREALRIINSQFSPDQLLRMDISKVVLSAATLALYAHQERIGDRHCYGMCLQARQFYEEGIPNDIVNAKAAININSPADPLGSVIDERQQRQNFHKGTIATVAQLFSGSIQYNEVLERIKTAIDEQGTALVALGSKGEVRGHQLLAYCYDDSSNTKTDVYVYDPDYSFASDDPAKDYVREETAPTAEEGYRTLTFDTDGDVEFHGYGLTEEISYDRALVLPDDAHYDNPLAVLAKHVEVGVPQLLSRVAEVLSTLIDKGLSRVEGVDGLIVAGIQSPADLDISGPDGESLPEVPAEFTGSGYEQIRFGYDIDPSRHTIRVTGEETGEYGLDVVGATADGGSFENQVTETITKGDTHEYVASVGRNQEDNTNLVRTDDGGDGLPPWLPVAGSAALIGGGYAGYKYLRNGDEESISQRPKKTSQQSKETTSADSTRETKSGPRYCRHCGEPLEFKSATYCSACGQPVGGEDSS